MEFAGAIYCAGGHGGGGANRALCHGPDGVTWWFEDGSFSGSPVRRLAADLSTVLPRSVSLVAYWISGGAAVFAGAAQTHLGRYARRMGVGAGYDWSVLGLVDGVDAPTEESFWWCVAAMEAPTKLWLQRARSEDDWVKFAIVALGAAPFAVAIGDEVLHAWGRCIVLRMVRARILEAARRPPHGVDDAASSGGAPLPGATPEFDWAAIDVEEQDRPSEAFYGYVLFGLQLSTSFPKFVEWSLDPVMKVVFGDSGVRVTAAVLYRAGVEGLCVKVSVDAAGESRWMWSRGKVLDWTIARVLEKWRAAEQDEQEFSDLFSWMCYDVDYPEIGYGEFLVLEAWSKGVLEEMVQRGLAVWVVEDESMRLLPQESAAGAAGVVEALPPQFVWSFESACSRHGGRVLRQWAQGADSGGRAVSVVTDDLVAPFLELPDGASEPWRVFGERILEHMILEKKLERYTVSEGVCQSHMVRRCDRIGIQCSLCGAQKLSLWSACACDAGFSGSAAAAVPAKEERESGVPGGGGGGGAHAFGGPSLRASQVGVEKRSRVPLAKRLRAQLGSRLRAQLATRQAAKCARSLQAPLAKRLRAERQKKQEHDTRDTAKRKASVFAADAWERECQADEAEQAVAEAKANFETVRARGAGNEELAIAQSSVDAAEAQLQERVGVKRRAVRASAQAEVDARKLGAIGRSSGPLGRLWERASLQGFASGPMVEDLREAATSGVQSEAHSRRSPAIGSAPAFLESKKAKVSAGDTTAPGGGLSSGSASAAAGGVCVRAAASGDRVVLETEAQGDFGWKRFSPEVPDGSKCMARVFGVHGCGGQCSAQRAGALEFCGRHANAEQWRVHGRVDGPIPDAKWKDFVKAAQRRLSVRRRDPAAEVAVHAGLDSSATPQGDGGACRGAVLEVPLVNPTASAAGARDASKGGSVLGKRSRKRGGVRDLKETLGENEFVEAAMRERGFQLRADGHWIGGLRLPGDPENDALLDNFLRHQYREKKEQEQESSSSVAWGAGQVLGGLDGGAKSK